VKTRPAAAELFHAEGRADGQRHGEANSRFSQLYERALKLVVGGAKHSPTKLNRQKGRIQYLVPVPVNAPIFTQFTAS
jgi:hypothetical protein